MKLSERMFNIIDRSREFIEIVTGTDLMAMAGLPSREKTIEFLTEAANTTKAEVALLEAKLTAIECGDCGKTMLTCGCDDVEDG